MISSVTAEVRIISRLAGMMRRTLSFHPRADNRGDKHADNIAARVNTVKKVEIPE